MKYPLLSVSAIILFLLLGDTSHAATLFGGVINEDTVWTASSSPYVITENSEISSGATLTLEPGVVVKVSGKEILVSGSLNAKGTQAEPVYITSHKDDSVGGDTDGSGGAPAPGNWRGVRFSAGAVGAFEHTVIRYAGFGSSRVSRIPTIYNQGAEITLSDSEISHSLFCGVGQKSGSVTLTNSSVHHHLNCGVFIFEGDIQLRNSSIQHTQFGIFAKGASSVELTDSTFENNTRAVDIDLSGVSSFIHSGNAASGGYYDGIVVRGVVSGEINLQQDSTPYLIDPSSYSSGSGEFEFVASDNLVIGASGSLTFEPGAVVKFDTGGAILVDGTLQSQGTSQLPVYFTSFKDDSIGGDTNGDADASAPATGDWLHIQFNPGSAGLFSNSVIRYGGYTSTPGASGSNIYNKGGTVSVSTSELAHAKLCGLRNNSGVSTVSQSNIHHNSGCGVVNDTLTAIDARNNYWGDPSGPRHSTTNPAGLGDAVSNNVLFDPWKGTYCTENCNSSVLFLPGIKGSILKKDRLLSTEDTLWPATLYSDDVAQLALTEEGESVEDVFVDGIVETYLTVPVYKPFSDFMEGLATSSTITKWESLPYDWRFLPEKIIEDGIKTRDEVIDPIEQIKQLALTSKSGKVTIVAHSMGGLMGKALIKELEAEDKADLIDSFIMIGSPQLGTPQAIGSLLHGDDEGIPGDLEGLFHFLNYSSVQPAAARKMGKNMPSAYNLLPSEKYFEEVIDPILKFDEQSAFTEEWRNLWGATINNYTDYASFITGQGVVRQEPETDQLNVPEILDTNIVGSVKEFHEEYDFYTFPEHIRVVQVAGWGRPTVKGILYTTGNQGKDDYNPIFTREGDKTVVYSSAISSADGEEYFFNIFDYNDDFGVNIAHKDLLNSNPSHQLISSVIKNEQIESSKYVSVTRPDVSEDEQLVVSSHSPVVLGVYDSEGNFTGVDIEEENIREEIPGSSLSIFGHSQYIFLPKEGVYDFIYRGIGSGPTTIKIQEFTNDIATPVAKYSDISTTPETVATFEVDSSTPEDTQIEIDQNGDGVTDAVVTADGAELSLEELIVLLKVTISNLSIKKAFKNSLLKKIAVLEHLYKVKNTKLQKLGVSINIKVVMLEVALHRKKGNITAEDATLLLDVLNKINEKI